MRGVVIGSLLFGLIACVFGADPLMGQRRSAALVCKRTALAAVKPRPELNYPCDDQLNDYDDKVLKLPTRLAAIKTLTTELASFNDTTWWTADPVDLGVCDFTKKVGTLTPDQRQGFLDGEYLFWLFGNDRVRLVLIPDPCYQTQYGGADAFFLYRHGDQISVSQALDGFFSRADNPINLAFAKLNREEIIEISTWSGGLNPSLTNYYFAIDAHRNRIVPKPLFKGERGPSNEISSAMILGDAPVTAPLKVVRGSLLAKSFVVYVDDANGKIDDNGRSLSRKALHFDGKLYR